MSLPSPAIIGLGVAVTVGVDDVVVGFRGLSFFRTFFLETAGELGFGVATGRASQRLSVPSFQVCASDGGLSGKIQARALFCLLSAPSGPFGGRRIGVAHGPSAAQHPPWPSPGSDDEAQSRPSRASRTRFCRPFPLSFAFFLRPTWKAALSRCFAPKKHELLILPHIHCALSKGAIQAAPGTVKRGPGKPHVFLRNGWRDPGSGPQTVTPARHLQALNSAISASTTAQRCHSDGQHAWPQIFPSFFLLRGSVVSIRVTKSHPTNGKRLGSKQKSATALANPLGGGAGDAPFQHPIRCSSAALLTLTGRRRPTCTANRGVEGRTLDVASESVAPALLSAVWGEGTEAPVRPTTALADQPPSFRSDGTCQCVCPAVHECVALGCVTVK